MLSRDPNICASCSSMSDGMLDEMITDARRMLEQSTARLPVAATEMAAAGWPEKEKVLTNRSS